MLTRLGRLGALCAVAILAAGCQTSSQPDTWTQPADYRAGGPVPPMESNRKINEQSCAQGIDLTAGNLMCR